MDDLFHLHRGGRLSKTAAIVGTMINLKPVLHVDDEGHLVMLSKVRGRKKSLIGLVDCMEKQLGDWKDKNDIIFISHGDCPEDAQFVADLIKERFGYENFMIDYIGATIGRWHRKQMDRRIYQWRKARRIQVLRWRELRMARNTLRTVFQMKL